MEEAIFLPITGERNGGSIEQYITREGMDLPGVGWGTHVEILAAAKLFNIRINVFMPHLETPIWQVLGPEFLAPNQNDAVGDIYITNTNGNHFDVVLETNVTNLKINKSKCIKYKHFSHGYIDSVKNNNEKTASNKEGKPKKTNALNCPGHKVNCLTRNRRCNSGKSHNSQIKLRKLKCFYTNARSVVNKFDELVALNEMESFDIIGITETWINCKVHTLTEFALPGYQLFNKDRSCRPDSTNRTI
jgi:acyl-CoA hydrolase